MHLIKLAVLGSVGSGKTSLIRQFVRHDLNDCKQRLHDYDDGDNNHVQKFYYPTVIVDDRVYEVQIADLPPLQHFPKDTLEEWNMCRGYGLRQATAFLLVFDASSQESFNYVRQIRDQILQYKEDPVILVAGNKQDLLFDAQAQADQQRNHPVVNCQPSINRQNSVIGNRHSFTIGGHRSFEAQSSLNPMLNNSSANYQLLVQSTAQNPHGSICITINQATTATGSSSNTPLMMNGSSGQVATGLECRSVADINKEYFNIARKQFKCPYVECSAKYNWHVTSVFKELMKLIEKRVDHETQRSTNLSSHGRKTCRMQ